ncbi:hypothetical protein BSAF29S_02752 [Bacillus safensis subsp. safensis]
MTILTAHSFRNTALIFLCLSAGIVDVIGYLSLGHVLILKRLFIPADLC